MLNIPYETETFVTCRKQKFLRHVRLYNLKHMIIKLPFQSNGLSFDYDYNFWEMVLLEVLSKINLDGCYLTCVNL